MRDIRPKIECLEAKCDFYKEKMSLELKNIGFGVFDHHCVCVCAKNRLDALGCVGGVSS